MAQIIENRFAALRKKSTGARWVARVIIVFLFTTAVWVFFAANSLYDVSYIFSHAFDGIGKPITYLREGFYEIGIDSGELVAITFSLLLLLLFDYISLKRDCIESIGRLTAWKRVAIYLFILCVILCLKASKPAEFVYFQV